MDKYDVRYTGDVPTSVTEGQQLLANILREKFKHGVHERRSRSVVCVVGNAQELTPGIPSWEIEARWAFWCNYIGIINL